MFNRAYIEMRLDGKPIHINGIVTEYETSIENFGVRETTVTIKEVEEAPNNLMHHLMHPQARCNPLLKEKEDESMSVKIRKQPKEISLEELEKGEEYEKLIIHIDNDKKEEIENKYGISYDYGYRFSLSDDEIQFKENYLTTRFGNVPYEFISKIEVVEK